mmetsp:Transcript_34428/g.63807  ORF Transcript_34428/g.63807 Transcript_34428/m.63807 type:complete len:213 (-) Transcript_34428:207-845(-)
MLARGVAKSAFLARPRHILALEVESNDAHVEHLLLREQKGIDGLEDEGVVTVGLGLRLHLDLPLLFEILHFLDVVFSDFHLPLVPFVFAKLTQGFLLLNVTLLGILQLLEFRAVVIRVPDFTPRDFARPAELVAADARHVEACPIFLYRSSALRAGEGRALEPQALKILLISPVLEVLPLLARHRVVWLFLAVEAEGVTAQACSTGRVVCLL